MKLFEQLPPVNQFRKLESVSISGAADFEHICQQMSRFGEPK